MSDTPEAAVLAYQDEEDANVGLGWTPRNLTDLDWAIERHGALQRQIDENNAVLAERIAQLKLRNENNNAQAMRGIAFFAAKIREYANAHRDELLGGGRKKTRDLPSGSVGFRKCGGGLKVVDKDAVLKWCQAQPIETGVLRVKEEPAVDAIKRHYGNTGEVPPGCDVEPEREEVVIKTAASKEIES